MFLIGTRFGTVFQSGTTQIHNLSLILSNETAARTFQGDPLRRCHGRVSGRVCLTYSDLPGAGNPFCAQFAFGGYKLEGVSGGGGDQQGNEEHAR